MINTKIQSTLIIIALVCLNWAKASLFDNSEMKPLYTASKEPIMDNYIVVLNDVSFDMFENHVNILQTAFLEANSNSSMSIASDPIKHKYFMPGFIGYSGTFSPLFLNLIRSSPEVAYVEQDSIMRTNNLEKNSPWGLARVSHRKPLSFGTFNKFPYDDRAGECVVVYVIDTGVNINHVDFNGRATWGSTIPIGDQDIDGNGHGSHCAGTIAGEKYGVAKKATIVAVKVLGTNGSGSTSDVLKGIQWAAKDSQRIKDQAKKNNKCHKGSVANMSLGGGFSRALNMIVNSAVEMGLNMAVAAGNDDQNACNYSPAAAENAVTVGATTINDERAWFSNFGECVDIFAPGKDITSIWTGNPHAINTISGTSMASPHIAGLLAYILSLNSVKSDMSPKELKSRLIELATKNVIENAKEKSPNLLAFTGYE